VRSRIVDHAHLRVVIAGNNFAFPEGQGASARVRAVGLGLLRAGANVEVVATSYSVQPGDQASNLRAAGWIDGIHYSHSTGTPLPSDSRVVRRWRRLRGYSGACLLAAGLGGPPPDAVLFFLNDSFALPLAVGSAARLRWSVLLLDGCELPFVYRQSDFKTQVSRAAYAKGFLNWYDGIFAISRHLEAYYRGCVGVGTAVMRLPILVDCDRFERREPTRGAADPPYIAYCGSLRTSKGIATLLRAFRVIASRHPNVTLRLTGLAEPRAYREELERLVSDLDLGERVRFLGLIPADDMPGFLQAAAALVVPHPAGDFSDAAFPTKLGEYLASGAPVVATRVGEIEEYLTDGRSAFLADPGQWESLVRALDVVFSNPERARLVGSQGAAVARREFDIGRHGHRLYEFIRDLRERKR